MERSRVVIALCAAGWLCLAAATPPPARAADGSPWELAWECEISSDWYTIHYNLAGEHATTTEYVDGIKGALDDSYRVLVLGDGFKPPQLPLNVYVMSWEVYATTIGPINGRYHIVLNKDRAAYGFASSPEQSTAHELFHVIQGAYDPSLYVKGRWISEGTAEWAKERVYPTNRGHGFPMGICYPNHAMMYTDALTVRGIEDVWYEAITLWTYLDREYPQLIPKLLELAPNFEDGFSLTGAVAGTYGASFPDMFKEFLIAYNTYGIPRAEEVFTYGEVSADGRFSANPLAEDGYFVTSPEWGRGVVHISTWEGERLLVENTNQTLSKAYPQYEVYPPVPLHLSRKFQTHTIRINISESAPGGVDMKVSFRSDNNDWFDVTVLAKENTSPARYVLWGQDSYLLENGMKYTTYRPDGGGAVTVSDPKKYVEIRVIVSLKEPPFKQIGGYSITFDPALGAEEPKGTPPPDWALYAALAGALCAAGALLYLAKRMRRPADRPPLLSAPQERPPTGGPLSAPTHHWAGLLS